MGFKVIKCPHCGREYLPVEIYYPNEFFGKPTKVFLNSERQIESIDGTDMDLKETYTCDDCRTVFNVSAKIDFFAEEVVNFDDDYSSPLYNDRISLAEPQ